MHVSRLINVHEQYNQALNRYSLLLLIKKHTKWNLLEENGKEQTALGELRER